MNKNFNALIVDAEEFKNFDFQKNDCGNFIDKARYLQLDKGNNETLIEYFERMGETNEGFFYVMSIWRCYYF